MRVELNGVGLGEGLRGASSRGTATGDASFARELARAAHGLAFSRHAQRRIERREVVLDPARTERLANAVGKAAAKGARQAVVMVDELAFVVDVRERTVVTALNHRQGGAERVFTNIDSLVIA